VKSGLLAADREPGWARMEYGLATELNDQGLSGYEGSLNT
jgi:hypothetical protein